MLSKFQILRDIHKEANRIYESDLPWSDKYELIFSGACARQVLEMITLSYSQDYMSDEDGVRSFMEAFNKKFELMERDFI